MNKKTWLIIIIAVLLIGAGVYWFLSSYIKKDDGNNAEIATENGNSITNGEDYNASNPSPYSALKTTLANNTDKNIGETPSEEKDTSETELANFSTKIYTKKSERQNNIQITCSSLNNTDIPSGSTFSFCDTVGKSTSSKGYQKADVFNDGKKVKALGGGNCQVSTTLYNAVLKVNGLSVTERHEHSNYVPYIQNGKDAAVAYGSYDLKFVNNLDYTVRIKASATKDNVSIKIVKLN